LELGEPKSSFGIQSERKFKLGSAKISLSQPIAANGKHALVEYLDWVFGLKFGQEESWLQTFY
jgi:hypothetical protein